MDIYKTMGRECGRSETRFGDVKWVGAGLPITPINQRMGCCRVKK